MTRSLVLFSVVAVATWIIDQYIKMLFVGGYGWDSQCISLELHYNCGVAFSLFAFLGPYLKWIQVVLIGGIIGYVFYAGHLQKYPVLLGVLIGAAISNLYDRFVHGGVVDYVAWHCGFDFAVFNFADVMIDIAIVGILIFSYLGEEKNSTK
jgi:signal peptidase II